MSKKKYKAPQPTRTLNKKERPPAPKAALNKKWLIGGAVALAAVVLLTVGLIRFYGETVVARVNGIRITESEVAHVLATDESISMLMNLGVLTLEEARQDAANQVALTKLFEDYARRNNIALTPNQPINQVRGAVAGAIIADPVLSADFEAHMPPEDAPVEERAAALIARIQAGEDFDTLMFEYSEDPGLASHPGGYIFTDNVMVDEFFEAARNLAIGEVSGPVETMHGIHILQRVEPQEGDMVMLPGQQQAPYPLETDEEVLGAKHILVTPGMTHQERMSQAIANVFEEKLRDANVVFLPALENVTLQ